MSCPDCLRRYTDEEVEVELPSGGRTREIIRVYGCPEHGEYHKPEPDYYPDDIVAAEGERIARNRRDGIYETRGE